MRRHTLQQVKKTAEKPGLTNLIRFKVQSGACLGDDDIVILEDRYARVIKGD